MKKNYFGCRFFNRAVRCMAAVLAVFAVLAGCTVLKHDAKEKPPERSVILMTWNVHNLFDGKDNGSEYGEFLESSGWSTEKYLGRINAVSVAIGSIMPRPDIILLQEIESLKILEDLALSMSGGYSWSHFANNTEAALGLGILSRLPISESRVHSITIGGDTTPRPVLETRVNTKEGEFVIFGCHWKSKLGGDDTTEDVRRASARVILRRIRELWKSEPDLGVIVAGDLNENHDEFYRRGANVVCALIPDDPYSAELTGCLDANSGEIAGLQKDFIVTSRNKPPEPVHFPKEAVVLFSPWAGGLENGSYFYSYNWETIDHFLVSYQFFDNAGLEYETVTIVNNQHFTNANGMPVPYNIRTGAGLSDHLPLLLTLKVSSGE
jgi:endonuclease/exonuclease/phosphatase family metal-dependent hydrolase